MNPVDLTLYVIVDPSVARGRDLADVAREAVEGGATLIQYRDKHGSTRAMVETARAIRSALQGRSPLLINDRVDVALAARAEGAHLGQDDMAVADARRLLGPKAILGLTIKRADHVARLPEAIDYACIGGVFVTGSKDNPDPPVGIAGFRALASELRRSRPVLPIGAIAGIHAGNAGEVAAAGADGVAVISAVIAASDVREAARDLKRAFESGRGT